MMEVGDIIFLRSKRDLAMVFVYKFKSKESPNSKVIDFLRKFLKNRYFYLIL